MNLLGHLFADLENLFITFHQSPRQKENRNPRLSLEL